MPRPFHELTIEQFAAMLDQFPFRPGRINAVHLHHTWRPNHRQFGRKDPAAAIEAMWRYHAGAPGLTDIAQHITIDPRGVIWTGRDWNTSPASAAGNNGNAGAGPFMVNLIGDFGPGGDPFEGEQRAVTAQAIALVQSRFGLAPETLRFHNQMAQVPCPGAQIQYDEFLPEVRAARQSIRGTSDEAVRETTRKIVELFAPASRMSQMDEGELKEEHMNSHEAALSAGDLIAAERALDGARATHELTAEEGEILRPHTINLRFGALSEDGQFQTSAADVEKIFGEDLAAELAVRQAQGRKLKLVFYAHGGLTGEMEGILHILTRLEFWRRNGMYPIFFVWETGLRETIKDIVTGLFTGRRGPLEVISAATDAAIEFAARQGGLAVWSQMKRSAEVSALTGGGALLVAQKTRDFWNQNHAAMEIHAVGHSAGAIFHAHFLPALLGLATGSGVPKIQVESLHFLAPAITTELFATTLRDKVGADKAIRALTMYTMNKSLEKADKAGPYRKSLLYLVSRAFERVQPTPILGLEESVRDDSRLLRFFGLAGQQGRVADLLFSKTADNASPRSATQSISHGGFDNDPKTMNSVARRILNAADSDPIFSFVEERAPQREFAVERDPAVVPSDTGRRLALCVGIDDYASPNELFGCVNDAKNWAASLESLGFQARLILNSDATRANILNELDRFITESKAGDVLAFQFAGHGTQVDDVDQDEDEDSKDEAMCPVDLDSGALIIDDDLSAIFAKIPAGVSVTCFIDCCHSGTIARLVDVKAAPLPPGVRKRFIRATPALNTAHAEFRRSLGSARAVRRTEGEMAEVLFAACLAHQVAFESDGAGDFTKRAISILRGAIGDLTNEQFQQRVIDAFGPGARQTPRLDGARRMRTMRLLQGIAAAAAAPPLSMAAAVGGPSRDDLSRRLEAIERRLSQLGV